MPPITDALPDVRRELRFFPLDVYSAAEADANRTYFDGLMARATGRRLGRVCHQRLAAAL
jgi:hypothetical protein